MTTGFRTDTGFKADQARGSDVWVPGTSSAGTYNYGDPITNDDRLFAMSRDPIGFRVVVIPALDSLDEWFNLVPTTGKEPEESFDQKLQQALSELNAKSELSKLLIFTNCFGWSILLKSYVENQQGVEKPLELNPSDIIKLTAYSPMQVSSTIIDKEPLDKGKLNKNYGKPLYYYINLGGVKRIQVHYSRVTLITNLQLGSESESWQGSSDLDAIMDDLVTLRNEAWAMGETLYRFVAPFFDLTSVGASQAQLNAMNADRNFDNMMLKKHFLHAETQTLKTIGFEGRGIQNPQNFYQPPLERISTKTNIPQGLLRGVQSGAVTGSETDIKNYFKGCVSNKQRLIEPTIRALIDEIALIKSIQLGDYKFNWPSPFQLSELEKANIEEIRARTISIKKDWLMRDELRQLDDPKLKALPAGQGGSEIVQKTPLQNPSQGQPSNS
ncbi:DUF1073 domain-containing protein [Candidatus Bathyarchaeota archaeon]|nr:DUF1073 domain-containing protein [Candidatus Bathyarchaeota archaeon]